MKSLNLRIWAIAVLALSAIASGQAAAQDKVSVGVFPIDPSRPLPPMSEILEKARDDSIEPLRELGGHVIWSKSSRVSGDSCITFLVEFTPQGFPRQRTLGRIILAVGAPRFLTIGYSAPADEFQEPKANDFLDSLTLLEGSR